MISFRIYKELQSAQGQVALDVAMDIREGETVAIYGASGAGKTTILRVLAGLLQPARGFIDVSGVIWLDTAGNICLPPGRRSIGLVFQDYALFPNMTVKGNLTYALGKGQNKQVVDELSAIMELEQLMDRYPDTLSGGQKQRVALARAIVRRPKLLLLDEPLSALDKEMRLKLQDYILKLHKACNLTTILVSHDIAEIYKMADRLFVLENGSITSQGTPSAIFSGGKLSGKFQITGEVIDIQKEDIIYLVSVLLHHKIVKVVATREDVQHLRTGDQVIVSSKAFNPIIIKADPK